MKPLSQEKIAELTPTQKRMYYAWLEVSEKAGDLKEVHPKILERAIGEAYERRRSAEQRS